MTQTHHSLRGCHIAVPTYHCSTKTHQKAAKTGQRNRLGPEKTKMQVLIHGAAMQKKQRYRQDKLRAAGKLWCEEDFDSMKLDILCKDIVESAVALPKKPARIFWAREEKWEKVKIGPGEG